MLNNLKKTQKSSIFMDDDDMDIDNMDFPLPSDGGPSSSSGPNLGGMQGMPDMAQMQKMMQSMGMGDMAGLGGLGGLGGMGGMGGMGGAQRPSAPSGRDAGFVAVATGPGGNVRKMNPEEYKE